MDLDLHFNIADDDDIRVASESSGSDDEALRVTKIKKKKKKKNPEINKNDEFDDDFEFDNFGNDVPEGLDQQSQADDKYTGNVTSLDKKIASLRKQKLKAKTAEEKTEEKEDEEEEEEEDNSDDDMLESSDEEEEQERDRLKVKERNVKSKKPEDGLIKYAEEVTEFADCSFIDLKLSRELLMAVSKLGYTSPTPIQASTIPRALEGRDICACANTGTGKTAAFMLPILERLSFRPRYSPMTRVLVLTPTRELAVQIHTVSCQFAEFICRTNPISIALSAGGLDIRSQEAILRSNPDIVIATPGRLIDHLHNAPNFHLGGVEVLVLDEADRMLDENFADQMKEVIRMCNRERQTMLFSATMTEQVNDLAAVHLVDPIKIFVNQNTDTADNLHQEFIRTRGKDETSKDNSEAIVAALVKRTFHSGCIVFINNKVQCRRMHILLGLMGVSVGQLHGNLSQTQRLESLEKFKDGEIGVLLATDLAARGLDIENVKTVINFSMPNNFQQYIHRVGRTARAGKKGRAISLVGEKERKILKEVIKKAKGVKKRTIPPEVLSKIKKRIASLEEDVKMIEELEEEEKALRATENQMNKAERLLAQEGVADRKRAWFQSHQERMAAMNQLKAANANSNPFSGAMNQDEKKKKVKVGKKKRKAEAFGKMDEMEKCVHHAAREFKRAKKEKRMHAFDEDTTDEPKKKKQKTQKKKSNFTSELTNTSTKSVKKLRHGNETHEEKKKRGDFKKKSAMKHGKNMTFKSKSRYKRR